MEINSYSITKFGLNDSQTLINLGYMSEQWTRASHFYHIQGNRSPQQEKNTALSFPYNW